MKYFVKENTWLKRGFGLEFGYGNGYVLIPKGNPLHGKHYDEIHEIIPELDVNGGLTFSDISDNLDWPEIEENNGYWVVGFDTAHYWDTLDRWTKKAVEHETRKLRDQLIQYTNNENQN